MASEVVKSQGRADRAPASSIIDVMSAQICVVVLPVTTHCKSEEKRCVAPSADVKVMQGWQKEGEREKKAQTEEERNRQRAEEEEEEKDRTKDKTHE